MRKIIFILFNLQLIFLCSCSHSTRNSSGDITSSYVIASKEYQVMKNSDHYEKKGIASWYGKQFHKRKTSSGEKYNMYAMTAAHKTLPLFTSVLVTNLKNGKQVVVKINDRGPFIDGRLIDLSYAAAKRLSMLNSGTVPVTLKALS